MKRRPYVIMKIDTDKQMIDVLKRDLNAKVLTDAPKFILCFLDTPPPGYTISGLSLASFTIEFEDFQDLVQRLFDLSLTHRVTQMSRQYEYEMMMLGKREFKTFDTPVDGYKFYLQRNDDGESNITPDFMEMLVEFRERVLKGDAHV
jgi:hypothetical protein